MRRVPLSFVAAAFIVFGFMGVLTLTGCGKNTGENGVNVGGAAVDTSVEARDKAAAAEEAAATKKP